MKIERLGDRIIQCRETTPGDRACLVGISGIDASGKGHIADKLGAELESAGRRVALINVDGWLNLPHVRFAEEKLAVRTPVVRGANRLVISSENIEGRHFYDHALRLDEMFARLILPLKADRAVDLTMDFAEETATAFRPYTYLFTNIDIILLEGIFIFKRSFVRHFDMKIWIECSFEAALERAIARGQEKLSPDATIAAYESMYFPAQQVHFEADDPIGSADVLYPNG